MKRLHVYGWKQLELTRVLMTWRFCSFSLFIHDYCTGINTSDLHQAVSLSQKIVLVVSSDLVSDLYMRTGDLDLAIFNELDQWRDSGNN